MATAVTSEELLNRMDECVDTLEAAQETVLNAVEQIGDASHKSGTETITGQKTFTVSPMLPTPPAGDSGLKAANTGFVASAISTLEQTLATGLEGKLDKTGGEITSSVNFANPDARRGVVPDVDLVSNCIAIVDKNGARMAAFDLIQESAGNYYLRVACIRKDNKATSTIRVGFDENDRAYTIAPATRDTPDDNEIVTVKWLKDKLQKLGVDVSKW